MRWLPVAVGLFAAASAIAPPAAKAPRETSHVQVLAINDFHGALEPPSGSGSEIQGTPAGGAAYLASHLRHLREGHPATVTVGAGDLIGGSPLLSARFHDEPAVAALDAMGLRVSAMGNHELDEGPAELARLQHGGCHAGGCTDGDGYGGARFRWLAANTLRGTAPLLPAFSVERVGGHRIAFIGLTLRDTPLGVAPGGTDGLSFADEADTANRYAAELRREDAADAVFVLLHQGGAQASKDPNACEDLEGPARDVAERLSADVDAVATAHTHQSYVCEVNGKVVASAASNGRLITDWDLGFDGPGGRVTSVRARNVVVTRDVAPDPAVQGIVNRYQRLVAPLAQRVVGHLDAPQDEEAVGTTIADADLAATRRLGADTALMNRAGIRTGLPAGTLTFDDAFDVLPFSHDVVVRSYTGAQLRAVLAQQFHRAGGGGADLARASNLDFDADGDAVTAVRVDGRTIGDADTVRVAMNRFLAEGGDGFSALRAGTPPVTGPKDVDALAAFLGGRGR